MNWVTTLLLAVVVLFAATQRLPAPIAEESTPTPAAKTSSAKSKPKPKSTESEPDHISRSARSFQGTWTGTFSFTRQDNTVFTYKKTLLISDRTAVLVSELTMTRPPGGTWNDLPAAINASPVVVKIRSRSNDLRLDGSNLIINWRAPQFSDWFPREIPLNIRQNFENDSTKNSTAHPSTTYTLNGDEMTGENAGFKTIYQRVK
jgi:hypothetical protein